MLWSNLSVLGGEKGEQRIFEQLMSFWSFPSGDEGLVLKCGKRDLPIS